MLEVEDVEQRQKRLRMYSVSPRFSSPWSLFVEHILGRLNGGVSSTAESSNLSFDFGVRTTFAMEPPTERAPAYFLLMCELTDA